MLSRAFNGPSRKRFRLCFENSIRVDDVTESPKRVSVATTRFRFRREQHAGDERKAAPL